ADYCYNILAVLVDVQPKAAILRDLYCDLDMARYIFGLDMPVDKPPEPPQTYSFLSPLDSSSRCYIR
ncbi:hypothetical protein BGZ52_000639, partial [Haplosporangium bisporale]